MTPYQLLLDKFHRGKSPYDGYPFGWSGCWYGDPGAQREIFKTALNMAKPGLVIEVGSFVGESAIFMAKHLGATVPSVGASAAILCVDTWLFGYDHHVGAPEKINMHFGRPDLFYRFMANVIDHGCQDVIVPFATDSLNGARVLKRLGITADLIYVDASHEEGDVLRDYEAYWPLLKSGGVMLVDDLSGHFPGVINDFERFCKCHGIRPELIEGEKAILIKP